MRTMPSFDRTFTTSRFLPHAPEAVYAAFEHPERLAAWWGPNGFRNTFGVFEFVPGGRWHFTMHGPDGTDYANRNVFVALEPARRVVIRHDGEPFFTLTVELAGVSGGTQLHWMQVLDDAEVARAVAPIVEPANEQNLDRLVGVLESTAATG
jgi:uncharacterized protein YndB with AHSA1/START domain